MHFINDSASWRHGMKLTMGLILVTIGAMLPLASHAGDAKAAEPQASTLCAGCHGPMGVSSNPLWPNLAGQKEQYLIKQLTDYKGGQRQDPVMGPLAQTMDAKAIEDFAAYYAKLPPDS
jgi:cytochrome c553